MLAPDVSTTSDVSDEWPYGFGVCCCGCGKPSGIAGQTRVDRGYVKGQPTRFARGHQIPTILTLAERFWPKVDRSGGPDACWPWTGAKANGGYGSFMNGSRKNGNSHRVAWELTHGPIPDGLVVDHLCRNRICQNPRHMELVTHAENSLRGISPPAENARKSHCIRGHEFTPDNTSTNKSGGRRCKACHRLSEARYRQYRK